MNKFLMVMNNCCNLNCNGYNNRYTELLQSNSMVKPKCYSHPKIVTRNCCNSYLHITIVMKTIVSYTCLLQWL